jgi:hypothetical protein
LHNPYDIVPAGKCVAGYTPQPLWTQLNKNQLFAKCNGVLMGEWVRLLLKICAGLLPKAGQKSFCEREAAEVGRIQARGILPILFLAASSQDLESADS